jgi:hypothetical protein
MLENITCPQWSRHSVARPPRGDSAIFRYFAGFVL